MFIFCDNPIIININFISSNSKYTLNSNSNEYDRINVMMLKGNAIRKAAEDNSILASASCAIISEQRHNQYNNAYIINSLKRPEEVTRLRKVYGNSFHLIAVYSDADDRKDKLLSKGIDEENAKELLERDKNDKRKYGQRTTETFALADLFINEKDVLHNCSNCVERYLRLLFGDPHITPRIDEYYMNIAFNSSLRSSDLSRQIGAVIVRNNSLLSIGANDTPIIGGGLQWTNNDKVKSRSDFNYGYDPNKKKLKILLVVLQQ